VACRRHAAGHGLTIRSPRGLQLACSYRQPSPVPFDCLIGICRIIGVISKAAWSGYGLFPALFDRLRVTRTLLGARNNVVFGHDCFLQSSGLSEVSVTIVCRWSYRWPRFVDRPSAAGLRLGVAGAAKPISQASHLPPRPRHYFRSSSCPVKEPKMRLILPRSTAP
jgi:hypothetical protein